MPDPEGGGVGSKEPRSILHIHNRGIAQSSGAAVRLAAKASSSAIAYPAADVAFELIENANDIVYTHDLAGNFTYLNRAGLLAIGYNRDELLRLNFADVVAPEYLSLVQARIQAKLDGDLETPPYPIELVAKDGRRLAVEVNARLVFHHGAPVGIQGIARDVTDRKQAEAALRESESKFRALSETASSAIFIYQGSKFLYVNAASESITGYSREELLHMNFWELVHPEFRQAMKQRGVALQKGEPVPEHYELKLLTKNGEEKWVHFSAAAIPFNGSLALLGTAFDISENKRSSEELLVQKAYLEQLFECAPEGVVVRDNAGVILRANREFCRMFGYEAGEVRGKDLDGLVAPEHKLEEAASLTRFGSAGGRFNIETVRRRKDGSLVDVSILGTPIQVEGGQVAVYVIYRDITERKRGEQALIESEAKYRASTLELKREQEAVRQSEARYRSLFERAAYGIYRTDMDGNFVDVNPAMVQMLGYESAAEVRRLKVRDVYLDPNERARILDEFHNQGRSDHETRWKRKDGKSIIVRLSGRSATDLQGTMEGYEVIAEDITERRALREQLQHSQKLDAVGRLAGGVAHDFNNLLTVIKGYSELVLDQIEPADPMRAQMEEVRKAADRAAGLTRQLLAFSRRQMLAPKVLDVNSIVANMDKLLRRLLGEDVELRIVLDPDLGHVKADPGQIEQVIMNLAVNARDAMPQGGQLTIKTANLSLEEAYPLGKAVVSPGRYVMLVVSDTGHGMTEDIRTRIFEPFFTTKEKGTGLGLSTVYGIVKQSGGYIWVNSELGTGSVFKVYLPQVDEAPDMPQVRTQDPALSRGTETILLLEDEDGVRALVRQMLRQHGYKVLETSNAGEALILCERHRGPLHLLLTDVVLTQVSGPEIAKRLTELRSDMRVLFMSGYTHDAIVDHGVLQPGIDFVQKPFSAETLVAKVRAVLDQPL